jgi:hypothetical protein
LIDEQISKFDLSNDKAAVIEHESGPEILVYITVIAAGFQLSSSIIDLIKSIIEARKKGIDKGDRPKDDLQIIVRGFDDDGNVCDETILTINHLDKIEKKTIKTLLGKSIEKLVKNKKKR